VRRDIIVAGASAGGVEALGRLVRALPERFPAVVFLALHLSPLRRSILPRILSRVSALHVTHPADGEVFQRGRVYVAPPDHHPMLMPEGTIHLSRGPRENGARPAVDPLFRSAALAFGQRAIGVVLTGNLDDGTAGLQAIKRLGGVAIVQDPDEADFAGMPDSAIEQVQVDYVAPLDRIGRLLVQLADGDAQTRANMDDGRRGDPPET